VDFSMAEMAALPQVGAAPKAVTLHGLAFRRGPEGFACSVTLDV
jgi:SHS2 domain-containing protein